MYPLIKNETLKMLKKKRLIVIIAILAIIITVFTYAEMKVAQEHLKSFGTKDWHVQAQQKIKDYQNRLSSERIPNEWKKYYRVQIQVEQYYLNHNVDPESPNAVTFINRFLSNSVDLFIPLMITVIATDIVSGEYAAGTMKLLLSRPVTRWKILLSKWITTTLFVSLILIAAIVLSYLISGTVFGYGGWRQPIFTGFQLHGTGVNFQTVHAVDQWKYILMESGLVWFSGITVACISFMISVLVRSIAAGMGIMLATLISGTILTNMVSSWHSAKYLFMIDLQTTSYLSGGLPPIAGMTLPFSLLVLLTWAICAMLVAFVYFVRKDVFN